MSDDADEGRGDPFADLDDAVGDRDGDPFDDLDEGPAEPTDPESSGTGDGEGPLSGRIEDSEPGVPSFSEGRGREGDPFDSFDDAFDEEDIDQLDPDAVWEELASAQSGSSVKEGRQRTYAEVSKHSYCEQCEHFSAPPGVRCEHEGTQIVEFLDMETVRVVDCPVVREREELREGGHGKD